MTESILATEISDQQIIELIPRVRQLAHTYARKFFYRAEADDLLGEGLLALVSAARRYEGRNGAALWTFAHDAVNGAMKDVRARPYGTRKGSHIELLGLEAVRTVATTGANPHSRAEMRDTLRQLQWSLLTPRERALLKLHYLHDLTITKIAQRWQVVPSGLRRMKLNALRKLRGSQPRYHQPEIKQQVAHLYQQGLPTITVARRLGINPSTARKLRAAITN